MVDYSEVFIGLDVSKDNHTVAVTKDGRDGEVRFFGEIASNVAATVSAHPRDDACREVPRG